MLQSLRTAARAHGQFDFSWLDQWRGGMTYALCYACLLCAALAAPFLMGRLTPRAMKTYLNALGSGPALFRRALLLACALMLALGLADLADIPAPVLREQAQDWLWPAWLAHGLDGWLNLDKAAMAVYAALMLLFMLALRMCLLVDARARWPWLAAQMLIAAALEPWTEPGLGYLVAAELAFLLPWRAALAGALFQAVLIDLALLPYLVAVGDGHPACNIAGASPPAFWMVAAVDWLQGLVFQAFAFSVGYGWAEALRGRLCQAQANAALQATQLLLTEAVRNAERARIADGVGRLAAERMAGLQLQLRLAEAQGAPAPDMAAAREAARLLGEELHGVAGESAPPMDLRQALETLCRGLPLPRTRLDMAPGLIVAQPALAHVLFRGAQEALSNALRHSGAARAVVRLEQAGGGLTLTISDNGKGLDASGERREGHGLTGMRERVAAQGGSLDILSPAGGGCCLRIWLPLAGERA